MSVNRIILFAILGFLLVSRAGSEEQALAQPIDALTSMRSRNRDGDTPQRTADPAPRGVAVLGLILRQGRYDLGSMPDLRLSSLLKLAGGITAKNSAAKIWVVRKTPQGAKRILVNAKTLLVQNRSEYDLFLRVGDVVIVE